MKKTLLLLLIIVGINVVNAQNTNFRNTAAVCGNGIVEDGEECDGTPGCTSTCSLIPAGSFVVEPSYGIKYVTNEDTALKSSNRSISLNPTTNQFDLVTNRHFNSANFSYGGCGFVDVNGSNFYSSYSKVATEILNKNFPLPIVGDYYVGNLLGEGINLKGIEIRSLDNAEFLLKTIIPFDIGEIDFDIFAATKQTDGKILLAGRCVLSQGRMIIIRLNTNFTFDTTFNKSGYIKLSFGSDCQARAIALQSEGKIIVAGHRTAPGSQGIVARLNTDGTLDTTFGDSGSKVFNYEINTQNNYFSLNTSSEVYSMFISSSDNIYLCGAGSASNLWSGKQIPAFRGFTAKGADWIAMNDLTNTTETSLFNVDGSAYKILAAPDESFFLGGFSTALNNKGLYLQRFNSVGNVNTNFNFKTGTTHGFYNLSTGDDVIFDMAMQNDGKIIVVGESDNKGFYTRILDSSLSTTNFDVKNNEVSLWPNPVDDMLNLAFKDNLNQELNVSIIDVVGKEIYKLANHKLNHDKKITIPNLESISKGVYFVKIQSASKFQKIKFVKK